jgi:NADH-quinone oxidoreductase subunit G
MCDEGRLNYKFINDPRRLTNPTGRGEMLTWTEALRQVGEKLRAAKGLAVLGSARATTEELFLLKKLGASINEYVPHTGEGDNFLTNADRNPNTNGAKLVGFTGNLERIVAGIRDGSIKSLVVFGEDVIEPELLAKLESLVVIDILPGKATQAAHFVLPATTFAETRGTFINAKGRLQRLNAAIPPVGHSRPGWQILAGLVAEKYTTIEEVFADMARTLPALNGLNLSKITDAGVEVKL